jgi:hypothetical protein
MFSLSKIKNIKNIKNILIILLLLPTTNYSMVALIPQFVPKAVPNLSGILCSGALMGSLIAKIGLEAISTSPKLMIGFSALSLGAGLGAYTFLNKYTPESTLENVNSTVEKHEKLMKNKMWMEILKTKENTDTKNLNAIFLEQYPGAFSNVRFSENDLKPQIIALKKANELAEEARSFINNPDKASLFRKLDNDDTWEKLGSLKTTIENHLKELTSISEKVHSSENFAKDSQGFFKQQNNQWNTNKASEKIKELQYKNSRFSRFFEALLSSPVIFNSILQIILNLMTPITG